MLASLANRTSNHLLQCLRFAPGLAQQLGRSREWQHVEPTGSCFPCGHLSPGSAWGSLQPLPWRCYAAAAAAATTTASQRALAMAKLQQMADEHQQLLHKITEASTAGNGDLIQQYSKQAAHLEPVAELFSRLKQLEEEQAGAAELAAQEADEELRQLAVEEQRTLQAQSEEVYSSLLQHLVPPEESDARNVVLEVRVGVGGEWAGAFAMDLLGMYQGFCEQQGWQLEVVEMSTTELGNLKYAVVSISGHGSYGQLRYEAGVHRATSVPFNSTKMQTSTASVVVLPEATEVDVKLPASDLRIDTFCASGPGGQHVNKTESAVRVTHLPTGLAVSCQSERSQHQNRARAMMVLRSKLHELEMAKQQASLSAARQAAAGSRNYNERIRSYYLDQGRVVDHRCGTMLQDVEGVMSGAKLGLLVEAMQEYSAQQRLAAVLEEEA